MGAPAGFDVEGIRAENEQLKAENAQLHSTVNELNNKVRHICLNLPCYVVLTLFSFVNTSRRSLEAAKQPFPA